MTTHQFAHKIKPLWKALNDIQNIASDMVVQGGSSNALAIVQIAQDARSKFNAEEQRIVDDLLKIHADYMA